MNPDIVTQLSQYVTDREDWSRETLWLFSRLNTHNDANYVLKLLCNSWDRVSTPLGGHNGPRCVAVNLSIDPENNRRFIVNFASKRQTEHTIITLENLIRHAFGNIAGSYLNVNLKRYIKKQIFERNNLLSPYNNANNIRKPNKDNAVVDHLINVSLDFRNELINSFENAVNRINWREKIHYLLLILTDILLLPDIFQRHFDIPENLDDFIALNMIAHNNDHNNDGLNIHPDSFLACQLAAENFSNRYIGTTFLCCIYCSIFLDCHNFAQWH